MGVSQGKSPIFPSPALHPLEFGAPSQWHPPPEILLSSAPVHDSLTITFFVQRLPFFDISIGAHQTKILEVFLYLLFFGQHASIAGWPTGNAGLCLAEIALHLLDLFFSHTVLSKSDMVFGVVIFSLSLQPKQLLQGSFQVMPSQHSTTVLTGRT